MATIRDHITDVLKGRNCPMNPMEFHMTSRLRYTPDQLRCAMEAMERDGQLQRVGKDKFALPGWEKKVPRETQEQPAKLTAAEEQELVQRLREKAAKEQEPVQHEPEKASITEQTISSTVILSWEPPNNSTTSDTKQEEPVTEEALNNPSMRGQVFAAIEAGHTSYDQICAHTGLPRERVHWAVKGLRRTGVLVKLGEGRWAIAGKAGDLINQHPALEAIEAVSRRVTYKIRDRDLKLKVLGKLGRIVDHSIAQVLEGIAEDLRAVG